MTKREKPFIKATVQENDGERQIIVRGQYARSLDALVSARLRGTTALEISTWALRLSHYIHILRRDYGLSISMVMEPHDGGSHGRYFLNSDVRIIERGVIDSHKQVTA